MHLDSTRLAERHRFVVDMQRENFLTTRVQQFNTILFLNLLIRTSIVAT